jgi:cell division septum initiation protein DivIVA
MKITQEKTFKPITITLETQKEADALLDLVDRAYLEFPKGGHERNLAIKISNWFTGVPW